MSRAGKTLKNVTENAMRAGGVATKNVGEAVAKVEQKLGVNEEMVEKIENKANSLGKDMYYYGSSKGNKVEKATNEMISNVKHSFHELKDEMKK